MLKHDRSPRASSQPAVRRRWLVLAFLIAAALRVGWVTVRFWGERSAELTYPDEETYRVAARSLARGEGLVFESGFRASYMPAYPAFIALFDRSRDPLFWARLVQAILGAWAAPAAVLLAVRWSQLAGWESGRLGSPSVCAVLAGLGVAFDPFLVFFSGLLLTETLFAAVLVTAWMVLLPMCEKGSRITVPQTLAAGLMLWGCVMLRPSAAVLVIIGPAAVAVCRRFDQSGLVAGVVMVEVVIIGLIPWAARNYGTLGEWRWLTTRGGITLYDGLQPGATGASDLADTKKDPYAARLSETEWDRYYRERALSAARQDPRHVLWLAGRKFVRTWSLTPNVETYHRGPAAVLSAAWMLILWGTAAVGAWTHRRAVRAWVILLLPVVAFTLVHMVFVGSIRYRVPIMPMMIVLSAAGMARAVAAMGRPRGPQPPGDTGAALEETG